MRESAGENDTQLELSAKTQADELVKIVAKSVITVKRKKK
jgi:hypothetical protein